MLLCVDIEPADEDAVYRFGSVAVRSPLNPAPTRIAGDFILALAEDQGDVDGQARSHELFKGPQATLGCGHFNHPVLVTGSPLFAESDVLLCAVGHRHISRWIFE